MNETKENNINDVKDPKRRREIIKTILIIFLAGMLILTFCSNTIMNRNLPEISTECATSGKLTEHLRGSGLVESNQSYEVTVDESKTINTINIKTGKEVKKGDVLFTLNAVDDDKITEAETSLEALELEYQTALLTEPLDYSEENQAISNAREDLNRAIALQNAAASGSGASQEAINQYNTNKRSLSEKTDLQATLKAAVSAIDSDFYEEVEPEYSGDLPMLYSTYSAANEEYMAAYALYSEAVKIGGDASSAKADADAKQAVRDAAQEEYNTAKSAVRGELSKKLSALNIEVRELSLKVEEYEALKGSESAMTYEEASEVVIQKQRALQELINSLNKTKSSNDLNAKKNSLELDAKQKAIEKQREKLEKMKKESGEIEVKSKYSGIVSSINVQPNDTTTPGTPLAVIDLDGEGYTVSISVAADKAAKIKKGTEADILNHWGGEVEAVVTDIKNDKESGSKNRTVVFSLKGDVTSGSYIDLSIPCGSGTYDAIVPKSAVYKDSKSDFVLVVKSKSSPLGNRYYAERVNVEVQISDELSSAVEGNIFPGDYIITASSKPIKTGSQVRMKEN